MAKNNDGQKARCLETFAFGAQVTVEEEGVEAFDEGAEGRGGGPGGLVVGFGEAFEQLILGLGVEGGCAGEGEVEKELVRLAAAGSFARGGGEVEAGEGVGGVFSGAAVKREEVEVGGH